MIRLAVEKEKAKHLISLGAQLLQDGTVVIPDSVTEIDRFSSWLPNKEGYIVQRPYFVLRAKCNCWKCKREMQAVALGAKCYQEAHFDERNLPVWKRVEECPMIFMGITYLDEEIRRMMIENYPFFKLLKSKKFDQPEWCNCCAHCGKALEENDDWRIGFCNPWSPHTLADARGLRVIYFKLKFDYYVKSESLQSSLYPEFL